MPFELLQKPIDIPKCVYHLHNPFAKAYIRAKLMIFSEKRCPTPQSITQPHPKNVIFSAQLRKVILLKFYAASAANPNVSFTIS